MFKRRLRQVETILRSGASAQPPPPRPLRTVQDVIDLLHEQVEALRQASWTDPIDKARAIAYLAGVARKAIETSVLAARLEMLEAVLTERKEKNAS